jgi:hypothetical protein
MISAASIRAQLASDLRSLDQSVHSHAWHKGLRHAGDGPAEFRALRALVPHHTPRPARSAGGGGTAWMS